MVSVTVVPSLPDLRHDNAETCLAQRPVTSGQPPAQSVTVLAMASKADPYAGIEFEEINEATGR